MSPAPDGIPYPDWLDALAWFSLGSSFLLALVILVHEWIKPQKMFIMNLVWPITALYGNLAAFWAYFSFGQKRTGGGDSETEHPSRRQVAISTMHCGAGCTLGDIVAESIGGAAGLAFAGGIFPTRLLLDFLLAWLFGVIFQYFSIVPMRHLSPGQGLLAAIRADTFSIVAFEIGLFAWMALTHYVIFPAPRLQPDQAPFWFMMQIGMAIGFFTSYPANVLLLRWGWKEKME